PRLPRARGKFVAAVPRLSRDHGLGGTMDAGLSRAASRTLWGREVDADGAHLRTRSLALLFRRPAAPGGMESRGVLCGVRLHTPNPVSPAGRPTHQAPSQQSCRRFRELIRGDALGLYFRVAWPSAAAA